MWIISGIAGVIVSYILNKIFVTKYGDIAIIYVVPVVEEVSKTISGYITGSIIAAHFIFGIAEALHDYVTASYKINFRAAVSSIMSHGILGILSYYLVLHGNIFLAIGVATLIHGLWNRAMLR